MRPVMRVRKHKRLSDVRYGLAGYLYRAISRLQHTSVVSAEGVNKHYGGYYRLLLNCHVDPHRLVYLFGLPEVEEIYAVLNERLSRVIRDAGEEVSCFVATGPV